MPLLAEVRNWLAQAAAIPVRPETLDRRYKLLAQARETLETLSPNPAIETECAELLGRIRVAERALDAELAEMPAHTQQRKPAR